MAVLRDIPCPKCDGRGRVNFCEVSEFGGYAYVDECEHCNGTGVVKVAITNNARLNELDTPEAKLKFFRGFQKWTKYAGNPLRLIFPESNDEEMLEWLNKISDESDDVIFENR